MKEIRKKSMLVTGGCGFIGSEFVQQAVALGHAVTVLDALTYAGHEENLSSVKKNGNFKLILGNICNGPLVSELLHSCDVDIVVNFAAESHVDRSIDSPSAFIETNIRGTFILLNAALSYWQNQKASQRGGFRYVQISTDEVFGSLGPQGKFHENSPMSPNSPYSASKAAGDHLVRAWHHTYGLPTITTNCSNNYGPRQYPEKLIPHMIACALGGKPMPVYGDGKNIRDWIHVEDHCSGIMLAIEKGTAGGTYCFGGDAERNNLEVVKTICKILDKFRPHPDRNPYESRIQFVADRLGHDRRYAIDSSFAQRELGFKRRYDFDSGLEKTVKWYLDNSAWCDVVTRARRE